MWWISLLHCLCCFFLWGIVVLGTVANDTFMAMIVNSVGPLCVGAVMLGSPWWLHLLFVSLCRGTVLLCSPEWLHLWPVLCLPCVDTVMSHTLKWLRLPFALFLCCCTLGRVCFASCLSCSSGGHLMCLFPGRFYHTIVAFVYPVQGLFC